MTGESEFLVFGEHPQSRGPAGQVDAAHKHRLELANLAGQLLLNGGRETSSVEHHHQAVAAKGMTAEDVNVPILEAQQSIQRAFMVADQL